VRLAAKAEVLCAPGEESVYSSATYSVLARVMEIASGTSYPELLQTLVCEPAGMDRTLHPESRAVIPGRASAYLPGLHGIEQAPPIDLSFLVGAGAVLSTPRDLHRLMRAVLDGRLGQAAQMAMIKDSGFDWNGKTNGFRAFADYDKSTGYAVIFTGNLMTGAGDIVRADVPKLLAGEDLPPVVVPHPEPVAVDPTILDAYVGTYADSLGQHFDVAVIDGTLYAGDYVLVPVSDREFYSPQDYHYLWFVLDDAGSVDRIDWQWGDGLWPWRPQR